MARRKKQNEDEQNSENINNESDDTFGLPEVEYEPLKRDEPKEEVQPEPVVETTEPAPVYERPYEETNETVTEVSDNDQYNDTEERSSYTYNDEDEQPSVLPKVLIISLIVLLLAGGGYWFFAVYRPKAAAEAERKEQERLNKERRDREAQAANLEAERLRLIEQRKADSLASIPKVGTLEKLDGRTGRYYVVVASAIDVDLLTDFGNQLVKKGSIVRIIPPFGKTKFHRLSVDVKDTYADAQAAADALKGGDYGNEVWVVKY